MARIPWKYEDPGKSVTWVNHYSSDHQILLVGEGDFSFSCSLAVGFEDASNIVATSLDSYDVVIQKYKKAKANMEILYSRGAQILHGVDARNVKLHTDLRMRTFHRIVYNFPHAGFHGKESDDHVIRKHQNLVCGFFENASRMLRTAGEVHVSHKTAYPFNLWNVKELACHNSLSLSECVKFDIEDYPGYHNKRGEGKNSDSPFPLGECCTFKFNLCSNIVMNHAPIVDNNQSHQSYQIFRELQCICKGEVTNNSFYASNYPP